MNSGILGLQSNTIPRNKYLIPEFYIHLFFIIGLLSTLSIRLIIIAKYIDPALVRLFWYMGISGYIIFFAFRFHITTKRKNLIITHGIIPKINASKEFDENDKELIEYILSSIIKSKEHLNYLFIFASSFAAIMIDLMLEY